MTWQRPNSLAWNTTGATVVIPAVSTVTHGNAFGLLLTLLQDQGSITPASSYITGTWRIPTNQTWQTAN